MRGAATVSVFRTSPSPPSTCPFFRCDRRPRPQPALIIQKRPHINVLVSIVRTRRRFRRRADVLRIRRRVIAGGARASAGENLFGWRLDAETAARMMRRRASVHTLPMGVSLVPIRFVAGPVLCVILVRAWHCHVLPTPHASTLAPQARQILPQAKPSQI